VNLERLCDGPLLAQADLFTSPSKTPWGGRRIVERYKRHLGIDSDGIVGESWELSGQPDWPSLVQSPLYPDAVSILEIAQAAPTALFGNKLSQFPFLMKLLNSGSWLPYRQQLGQFGTNAHELHTQLSTQHQHSDQHRAMMARNLSVQVHPRPGLATAKSEAWVILEAEEGAGCYLGLRDGITQLAFERAMRRGEDLSQLLQFVPMQAGDVFWIPSGTLHAVGAGILMLEPQQSSQVTFRAYDWGRARPLHFEEVLSSVDWDGPGAMRCQPRLASAAPTQPEIIQWVQEPELTLQAIRFDSPDQQFKTQPDRLLGYFVGSGCVTIECSTRTLKVPYGRSFFLPAAIGPCLLRATDGPATLWQC